MKPFYWQGTRNFGDYLNSWLWPRLLPGCVDEDQSVRLVGIGSLLKSSLNLVQGKKVIFGTGSGYGSIPAADQFKDWDFRFVRGPLTAECFGLPPEKSIIDGAWLIALLPEFEGFRSTPAGTTFIPHWTSAETGAWAKPCAMAGFSYLDPQGDLEGILGKIASSELVVTESLHGAIIADLFRVPWIPVRISPKFLPFKWLDWFQSIELEGKMRSLPLSDLFDYLYNGGLPGKVDYSTHPLPIPPCSLQEDRSHYTKPGRFYGFYNGTKRRFRSVRKDVLEACMSFRGYYPLSFWNVGHQARLAESLSLLARSQPYLSEDKLWHRRMDQLHVVTEQLKRDFVGGGATPAKL